MYHRTNNSRNILFVNTYPIIYHTKRAAPAAALLLCELYSVLDIRGENVEKHYSCLIKLYQITLKRQRKKYKPRLVVKENIFIYTRARARETHARTHAIYTYIWLTTRQ